MVFAQDILEYYSVGAAKTAWRARQEESVPLIPLNT